MNLENNAYFWQKLDTLLLTGTFTLKYNKGERHAKYSKLVYPLNYGLLKNEYDETKDMEIPCYKGSLDNECNSIIVSVDILSRECVVQLLIGLTDEETEDILSFLNETEFQKTILVRRGNEVPSWAE